MSRLLVLIPAAEEESFLLGEGDVAKAMQDMERSRAIVWQKDVPEGGDGVRPLEWPEDQPHSHVYRLFRAKTRLAAMEFMSALALVNATALLLPDKADVDEFLGSIGLERSVKFEFSGEVPKPTSLGDETLGDTGDRDHERPDGE